MKKLEAELDRQLGELGLELVTLERGGGRKRPVIRLRVDRRGGEPGRSSVTAEDCARTARHLREFLEGRSDVPGDYVLEVSSPGVERPLVRSRDYRRFEGERIRVRGYGPLAGRARQLEGRLLGLGERDEEAAALEIEGERIEIPLSAIAKATLVHDWEDEL